MILRASPGRRVEVEDDLDERFLVVPEVPEEDEDVVLASEIADEFVLVPIRSGRDPPAADPYGWGKSLNLPVATSLVSDIGDAMDVFACSPACS